MEKDISVQTYTNEDLGTVRTVEIDGVIYFVAIDVATILGYTNPRDAIKKHVDDEDKNTVAIRDGNKGNPNISVINESGLYSLILQSKLPKAKDFKRWVTSEVLPAIRKSGFYSLVGMPNETAESIDEDKPTKETTAREYLQIAKIIATCKQDRLPLVLNLLQKGGWEVATPQELVLSGVADTSGAGEKIEAAMQKYGLTYSQLAEAIGWNRITIYYYYTRQRFPKPKKYVELLNDLDSLAERFSKAELE